MITRRPHSHRDTPDNTGKTPDQKPQRLNEKLSFSFNLQVLVVP
jgi:hypothetical protein